VAFSPDSKSVLTASYDSTVRLWDVATGQELRQFAGHPAGAGSAVFSPDGKYMLTAGFDATPRLWDAQTGQELRQFIGHTDAVFGLAFTPDGRQILTSSVDGTARLWRTDLQDVIRLACAQLRRDLTDDERKQYTITDNSPTCPKT
jgi:WD40 repeat protein